MVKLFLNDSGPGGRPAPHEGRATLWAAAAPGAVRRNRVSRRRTTMWLSSLVVGVCLALVPAAVAPAGASPTGVSSSPVMPRPSTLTQDRGNPGRAPDPRGQWITRGCRSELADAARRCAVPAYPGWLA